MEKTKVSIRKLLLLCLAVVMLLSFMAGCRNSEQPDPTDGTAVSGSEAEQSFRDQMADSSVQEITLSGNLVLTAPVEVSGTKVIVGDGTVTAAEGLEGEYMFLVSAGSQLTVGENVIVDAANLAGAIHVSKDASLTLKDSAVVKNASADAANALVEGTFRLEGGVMADAQGHNLINKSETVIVGGEITGSGEKFAGIYNEGKLTQDGGTVSAGYNNIVIASGASYDWNAGIVQNSVADGIRVDEGATLYVASKEAQLLSSGGRGILLNGDGVIDSITVKESSDTQIKVGKNASLKLAGGAISAGSYHGVDNAGTMTMTGGDIFGHVDCGIINTGTLEITSAGIMNNGNKGILNKHAGKATVVSEDVMISGNKIAVANEDTAYFELAKATVMQSSMTNVYAYGGEMYIHDISLSASSSNNVRIVTGSVTMKDSQVMGNSASGSTSMHGILMEGGSLNAENVTIANTTGAGIRNKGGQLTGKNITLTNNKYIGINVGDQDVTGRPGTTTIDGLTVNEQGYMSILSNGTGVIDLKNAVLEATPSNNVRVNGGTVKLTDVEVRGQNDKATTAHHGIYLEGGEIIANNVTVSNTKGHGIRNKSGDFTGYNVTIRNVNGETAISNTALSDGSSGTITLYNVSISGVTSKNIVSEAGTTCVYNSTLSATPGSNIKITGGNVVLNNVDVMGSTDAAQGTIHAIILENGYGTLSMEDVTIVNAKVAGIRNKTGVVTGKNVTIKDSGGYAISSGADADRGLQGVTTIDGLTVSGSGNNNIVVDAGEVTVSNATLAPTASNNVKAASGLLTLKDTVVEGSTESHGVIAEGGNIDLVNVTIKDVKNAGIRVNKETSTVTGTNVIIDNTTGHGLSVDKGAVIIDGLTTTNIGQRNIQVGGNVSYAEDGTEIPAFGGTVKITNGDLCLTENQHSVVAYGEGAGTMLELNNVVLNGSGDGRHVILAEGGNAKLTDVTIKNANSAALRVNRAGSTVEAENLTIEGGNNGITASAGLVTVKNLTANAANRNISGEGATIVVDGATLGTTGTHNIKINKGSLTLKNAVMEGSNGRGIMIEPGKSDGQPEVILEKVTISNTKSQALENRGGIVFAKDLTIDTPKGHGVYNMIHKDGKTCGTIEITNLYTSGITANSVLQDCEGTVTVTGGTLGATGEKGAATPNSIKVTKGTINLYDLTIEGTTIGGAHGVMAEGGDVNLENVTIKNTKGSGIRVNRDASTVTGTNITVQGASDGGIFASAGTVTVSGYTASGNNRNVDVSGATVTITDAALGTTTTHNVKASAGTVALTNAVIEGSSAHGIIAEGGDFTLTGVTIRNAAQAGIRMNQSGSEINAANLTIEGCTNSISANAGTMVIDTMKSASTGINVIAEGATITVKNATLTNGGTANVVAHTGGTLNLENVEVGAAGEGFYQIYNTAENLNLSGKIVGDILNDKAVAVNVTAALSEDTAIVIDWTEGNAPSGTAIAFAEGTVEAGKNCFTLGQIQIVTKELLFTGNTGILKNLSDYVAQIGSTKYESLEEAAAAMGQLTGDVTMNILADCGAADPIVVPEGVNLTIQGGASIVGLDATIQVSEGASLIIAENVTVGSVDATAGGSIIYGGNTATAESPLTVIVKGEPHEVALTLAEGSTATADLFKLVDAEGNLYGTMIEDGKVKVYTVDVSDEATLQAAITAAPDNAKGYIILTADVTLSSTLTFPENKVLTVQDDGNVRTIIRTSNEVDMIYIGAGADITMKSSTDETVNLVLDGKSVGKDDGSDLSMVKVAGGTATIHNIGIVNANKDYNLFCSSGSLTVTNTELGKNYNVSSVYVTGGRVSLTKVTLGDAGSNAIRAKGGEIMLHNVTVNGHTRTESIHSIMIDGGKVVSTGTLTMNNSTHSGIRVSSGSFTGETVSASNLTGHALNISGGTVTIETLNVDKTSSHAIYTSGGTVTITKGGEIKNATRNLHVDNGTVSLVNMILGKTPGHNAKLVNGSLTLTDTVLEGTTSNYGLIIESGSGTATLNNVTIKDTANNGIHITSGSATLLGDGITVENAGNTSLNLTNGPTVDISNFTTKNVTKAHSIKATGASKITINGMNLAESNSNNINLNNTSSLTLKGTCVINGTRSNNGIILNGTSAVYISGDFTTQNCAADGIASWGGTANLEGKVNTTVRYLGVSGTLNVTGALVEGSAVVVDWNDGYAPTGTAIQFASADDMNASKGYITLGEIQAANYELSFNEAAATLTAKTAASGLEPETAAQEQ